MFTLQAGQIENALRGVGVPDISAKEMMQGVANCHAPLEHRGPIAMTKLPRDNRYLFPGGNPVSPSPEFYFPTTQNIVQMPPWQNVPWTPIPYPDYPQWQPIPFPEWPGGQYPVDDTTTIINGPTYMGDVTNNNTTTNNVNSQTINNAGDLINNNLMVNQGPVINNGPVNHNRNVFNNRFVFNNQNVFNRGPVDNRSVTNTYVNHSYDTHNHGDTHNYGPTYMEEVYSSGPNEFAGDTYIEGGDVYVDGDTFNVDSTTVNLGDETSTTVVNVDGDTINMGDDNSTVINVDGDTFNVDSTTVNLGDETSTTVVNVDGDTLNFGDTLLTILNTILGDTINIGDINTSVVRITGDYIYLDGTVFLSGFGGFTGISTQVITDIEWDGTNLIKKYRTVGLLGSQSSTQEETVVSGTSCPSTPIGGAASNYTDMP